MIGSIHTSVDVDILGQKELTAPKSGERYLDDLHMDTLPFKNEHNFVKDQDVNNNNTETDWINDLDECDSDMDEMRIYSKGIVSSLFPSPFMLFMQF